MKILPLSEVDIIAQGLQSVCLGLWGYLGYLCYTFGVMMVNKEMISYLQNRGHFVQRIVAFDGLFYLL